MSAGEESSVSMFTLKYAQAHCALGVQHFKLEKLFSIAQTLVPRITLKPTLTLSLRGRCATFEIRKIIPNRAGPRTSDHTQTHTHTVFYVPRVVPPGALRGRFAVCYL